MSDDFDLVSGSGDVFHDLGHPEAAVMQIKAMLAGRITDALDAEKISVRRAHQLTGFAAADFSRLRQARVQRFTIDRLIVMLGRLDRGVEVELVVRPRRSAQEAPQLA